MHGMIGVISWVLVAVPRMRRSHGSWDIASAGRVVAREGDARKAKIRLRSIVINSMVCGLCVLEAFDRGQAGTVGDK